MIDFKKKLEEEEGINHDIAEINEADSLITRKKKRFSNVLIFVIVLALIFSGKVIMSSPGSSHWFDEGGLFNKIKNLTPSLDKQLQGEEEDRINILILGMGGEGHDGAFLTDTIMLASIKPSTKEVSLISFPRDIVSPTNNWRKINSINAYAETREPGSGGTKTKESMAELLQIDIHYYIRVDFSAFERIIDEVGGIEVTVENSFSDYRYPIDGQEDNPDYYARFEHLRFEAGKQKMDGNTALKYARSRHGTGIEGSDYARARRQQLVIEAVKNKLLSAGTLLNPFTVTKLYNEFSRNVSTNLESWEIIRLWDIGKGVERDNIINFVLNDAPNNYLVASRGEDGAFILLPKTGNFSDIRSLVSNIFPEQVESRIISEPIKAISGTSSIAVLNGTWVTGLAGRNSAIAKQAGFEVLEIANAPERNFSKTVIYDLSGGEKNHAISELEKLIGAEKSNNIPSWALEYEVASNTPDLILVLGTDSNNNY